MTNPAEKIRQVVETLVTDAKRYGMVSGGVTEASLLHLLDAIIEEMERRYLESEHPNNGPWDYGYRTALNEQIKQLKEARSSLDGGGTSITNSTPE